MPRIKKIGTGLNTCTLDELLFPVTIHDNPRRTNPEYSKVVTGYFPTDETTIDEGGNVVPIVEEMDLNYCSPKYALVPNKAIFPEVEQVLFNNAIDFEAEYAHINNVRFYADYVITDKRYAYNIKGTTDTINPMLRVRHSYNGLTKYGIVFGYYRLVCTNGLTIPVAEMKEFNLSIVGKHTESILGSFEKLNTLLQYFAQNAKQITQTITAKYDALAEKVVAKPHERIAEVLEKSGIISVDNSKFNTVNDIMGRIMREANTPNLGYNGKVNDWLIYNGINQYLNDESLNIAAPEKRAETDSKVLEFMLAN